MKEKIDTLDFKKLKTFLLQMIPQKSENATHTIEKSDIQKYKKNSCNAIIKRQPN